MEGKGPAAGGGEASASKPTTTLTLDDVPKYYYPDRLADMREVASGYDKWKDRAVMLGLAVVLPALIIKALLQWTETASIFALKDRIHFAIIEALNEHPSNTYLLFSVIVCFFLLLLLFTSIYFLRMKSTVYLLDFATYQPPDELKMPHDRFMVRTRDVGWFTEESCEFQEKILYRTGLGNDTYFPPGIHAVPPMLGLDAARKEAEMVLFGCMDELFQKN